MFKGNLLGGGGQDVPRALCQLTAPSHPSLLSLSQGSVGAEGARHLGDVLRQKAEAAAGPGLLHQQTLAGLQR